MDLQTLQFFCAAANEGSLTKAAQALNYAQPNLSTRIHALEEELGVVLFERSSEGVRLTPKGELLYSYAQRVLKLTEEAAGAVRDDGEPRGTLRLGALEAVALSLLPEFLRRYHQQFPQVRIILSTMTSRQAVQGVLEYDLDAAVIGGEIRHPKLEKVSLTHDRLALISAEEAPLEELLLKPLVVFPRGCAYRRALGEIQARWGVVPDEVMEMNSLSAIFASVSAGLGVSVFPRSAIRLLSAEHPVCVTELPFDQAEVPISMIYRNEGHIPSAILTMARCFRQWSRDI